MWGTAVWARALMDLMFMRVGQDERLIPVDAYETIEQAYEGILANVTKIATPETFNCN